MTDHEEQDPYVELFHEPRTNASGGKKAPSIASAFGIAAALVVGFGIIVTTVVLWGQRTEEERGANNQPAIYVCAGRAATIVGTDGDDDITGTAGNDVIHARRGNDTVRASGGDDVVCGGAGNDVLRGGAGNDDLRGEAGTDLCRGGGGSEDRFESCETQEQ